MALNKIPHVRETQITWRNTGGTRVLDMTSIASGEARQGARHDFTTGSIARLYEWSAFTQLVATPTLGELIYVFWKWGDGSQAANDHGTGDIDYLAADIDKLRNLEQLGAIEVDQAAANIEFTANGILRLKSRYGHPVLHVDTAVATTSDATEHGFTLTPIVPEIE